MPILHEPDPPQPPLVQGGNINGLAVAVLLAIASIVGAVWAVDDHFISRREFNTQMRIVSNNLRAINAKLGIVTETPVVPDDGGGSQ